MVDAGRRLEPPGGRSAWIASACLVAAATLVGLILWPRLPDAVAIHFGASGDPTGTTVRRPVAIMLVPTVALAALGLLRAAAILDAPGDERAFAVTVVGTAGMLSALHVLLLLESAVGGVPTELLLPGTLVWGGTLLVYVLWRERLAGPS